MNLKQLKYFLAIAEHGTFLKASEKVYIAQSALSHQIALLEEELGTSLFHRSRRGVTLTEAGEVLMAHAKSILRQVDDARESLASLTDSPAGKVTFGIPHSVSNALALPLLQAVRRDLPRVHLELTEELTGNLSRQLHSGQIHMAVLFDEANLEDFTTESLVSERLSLIAPPDLAPASPRMTLHEALGMPLILPAQPHGVRPIIENAAAQAGYAEPNVVADISSISILRTSLLAGMGCTLLPVMPLQNEIDLGMLKVIEVDTPTLTRSVMLCRSSQIPMSAAASSVWRVCIDLAQSLSRQGLWRDSSVVSSCAAS
jgi:LysR family nitrogen assimilation transcriptional regulator